MPIEASKAEQALVQQFLAQVKNPDDIEIEKNNAADQRGYIKDALLRTENETVSTNYVYEFQTSNIADLFPRDPMARVTPRNKMWGPGGTPPEIQAFSDTMEHLINFMQVQGDFKGAARSAAREALTVPTGFIKLIWYEDQTRDPIGARRHHGPEAKVATYTRLYQEYKANEFDKDDADYARLQSLSDSLKEVAMEQIKEDLNMNPAIIDPENDISDPRVDAAEAINTGGLVPLKYLPEVPVFQGFDFEVVEFEDVAWDWNLCDLRDWFNADWVAHRVRMTSDEVIEKFGLDDEQAKYLMKTCSDGQSNDGRNTQEFREDVEHDVDPHTLEVWERQDQTTGRVYVYTESYPAFLSVQEPEVTHNKFFTLFPLQFNSVAGEVVGISDVDKQRPLQDEINERRTWKNKAIRSKMPRFAVAADAAEEGEIPRLMNSQPFTAATLKTTEDPSKKIYAIRAENVDMNDFMVNDAVQELQIMASRPVSALGGATSDTTATEVTFAASQLSERVSIRRTIFQEFMNSILGAAAEILLQTMDDVQVKSIVGPGAFWPQSDREHFFMETDLTIKTSMDDEPNSDRFLERMQILDAFAKNNGFLLNPEKGMEVLEQVAREHLKLDLPANQWYFNPMLAQMQQQGGAGGVGEAGTPGPNSGALPTPPAAGPAGPESLPGNAQTVQNAVEALTP